MKLNNKNILLISPEPWGHIFVSKHHYAVQLSLAGNRVYFLNPPSQIVNIEKTKINNLKIINYKGFIRGLRFFPDRIQQFIIAKEYNRLQKRLNIEFDIIWSFDNSVFYDFSALPKNIYKILHIVDKNQDFQTKKAASTANLCLAVLPEIVSRLKRYNENSYLITHGVQEFPKKLTAIQLPGSNKVKALYIGNLSMKHIEWPILYDVAQLEKKVDFVFIGSEDDLSFDNIKEQLRILNNTYFLDEVEFNLLPFYLAGADILLAAYDKSYLYHYASPHKMMEYLASGRMIICSYLPDYEHLKKENLIGMCYPDQSYKKLFHKIIANLEDWNSEIKTNLRKSYARQNLYILKIDQISKLING